MLKPLVAIGLSFAVAAAVAGCAAPQQRPSDGSPGASAFRAEYRLYTATPDDHGFTMGAKRLAELVQERTGGRITIRIFPNGQLAPGEREALQGLKLGTIDMFSGTTGTIGNFAPEFQVLDIPFLFRDYQHADKVLDGPIGRALLDELGKAQIKGLAFGENGFRNLTNSKHPVARPEDVKGLKLRTQENKVHIDAWKTLGAAPTPMAWGEVFTALQQKVIDGQENPVGVIYSAKVNEVQKYLTLSQHAYSPAIFAMSEAKFQAMPKADQELFVKAAAEAAVYQRQLGRESEAKLLVELKQRGMQVIEQVDTAAWQAAMQPIFAKYGSQYGERFKQIVETK